MAGRKVRRLRVTVIINVAPVLVAIAMVIAAVKGSGLV
jgi:hypothetical protein